MPLPGDQTWTQILTKTSGRMPAFFVFGLRQSGPGVPLDLGQFGWKGCTLYTDLVLVAGPFTTTGGGSGAGGLTWVTKIPAIGTLAGAQFYSQWLIFDSGAANGVLSTSNALWHIIGS